jgi:hypothetical protein
MARNNLRTIGFITFFLLVVFAIAFFLHRRKPAPIPPVPPYHPLPDVNGDSPAEVVGGSIFLKLQSGYTYSQGCNEAPDKICVSNKGLNHPEHLEFENLGDKPSVDAYNGWIIHISNLDGKPDGQAKELKDAVQICSDPNCGFNPPTSTFYVVLRTGLKVDPSAPHGFPGPADEIHYHDSNNCPGPNEKRDCDRAVHFTFDIGGAPSDVRECKDDTSKKCITYIGTRAP